MEDAIFKWLVTVGIPLAVFSMGVINKTKEAERRITLIEANQRYIEEKFKDFTIRLSAVENNYAILLKVEEQLKILFKQNEEIKEEIKSIREDAQM